MAVRVIPWLLILGLIFSGGAWADAAERSNPYASVLIQEGITPDLPGVSHYLRQLQPTQEERRRAEQLVQRLGSESFLDREAAMTMLARLPKPPVEALREASESDDPEIRWRAIKILKEADHRSRSILYAVLRTIELEKIEGAAAETLAALPLCHERYLRHAARAALMATVRSEDAQLLRSAASEMDGEARPAAVAALGAALGKEGANEMAGLLDDKDAQVQLAAARALANLGDRRSLPALVNLLSAKDLDVRARSYQALRSLTGRQIAFTAYAAVEEQAKQVAAWRQWLDEHGERAELTFPLMDSARVEIGLTLIALYNQHRVIEVDQQGKMTLEIKGGGYNGPWGAVRLDDGNILVNWYSSHCVVEYDSKGEKEVWKKDGLNYPWSAERLPNGNTLIACNQRVVEVDSEGKEVWEAKFPDHVVDADRLENGNTLLGLLQQGRVLEIDPEGKTVWEVGGLQRPYRVQRLENGNTLIAEKGRNRVVELDPSKEEIWSRDGFNSTDGAQRLANGNTLVSDGTAVYEFAPDEEKPVWTHQVGKSIARRY